MRIFPSHAHVKRVWPWRALRSHRCCLSDKALEFSARERQFLEQRRGRPQLAVLPLELANAIVDLLQAYGIGVPHRTATECREAVAVQVNNVDVHGAQSVALFKDARALVYQR